VVSTGDICTYEIGPTGDFAESWQHVVATAPQKKVGLAELTESQQNIGKHRGKTSHIIQDMPVHNHTPVGMNAATSKGPRCGGFHAALTASSSIRSY
jgi:hypothetical protein